MIRLRRRRCWNVSMLVACTSLFVSTTAFVHPTTRKASPLIRPFPFHHHGDSLAKPSSLLKQRGHWSSASTSLQAIPSLLVSTADATLKTTTWLWATGGSVLTALDLKLAGPLEKIGSFAGEVATTPGFWFFMTATVILYTFKSSQREFKKERKSRRKDNYNIANELYDDLYGTSSRSSDKGKGGLFDALFNDGDDIFSMRNKRRKTDLVNKGVPEKEYLKITNLNAQYDSYDYTMTKATRSKAAAAASQRSRNFERALSMSIPYDLEPYQKEALMDAEKKFLLEASKILGKLRGIETKLMQAKIDKECKKLGLENLNVLDAKPSNATTPQNATTGKVDAESISTKADLIRALDEADDPEELLKDLIRDSDENNRIDSEKLMRNLMDLRKNLTKKELKFVEEVIRNVGTKHAQAVRTALLGDSLTRGTMGLLEKLQERPLTALFGRDEALAKPRLYVSRFPGDISASQVSLLRQEITAILNNARPGTDEVLVILESGGGTVTGYGLASGQLQRLKSAGIKLTIAVEQVAASGGYMMACVADKIVASPFAVLGSIGVITEIPNVYERLKKEGIEFQTVTAGEFKRTLTPTKKVTTEDAEKTKAEIEEIFTLFKSYVGENRPQLKIEEVATGESWFGSDALERGLCDEIKAVDDVLVEYVKDGYDVFEVKYSPPKVEGEGLLSAFGETKGDSPRFEKAVRWFIRIFLSEIFNRRDVRRTMNSLVDDDSLMEAPNDVRRKYMMMDDTQDRYRY